RVLSTLQVAGYSATRVLDERLGAQADTTIFAYARSRRMTIVTFDTDYLNRTKFPPPHSGILILRFFPRGTSVTDVASAVLNAVTQLASFDISNRVYRIDPSGVHEEV